MCKEPSDRVHAEYFYTLHTQQNTVFVHTAIAVVKRNTHQTQHFLIPLRHYCTVGRVNAAITSRFLPAGAAYHRVAVSNFVASVILFQPRIKTLTLECGHAVETAPIAVRGVKVSGRAF